MKLALQTAAVCAAKASLRNPGPNPVALELDLTKLDTVPIGTYTRATGGYTFNSAGVLVANSANLPRVDYDPATLVKRGWLMDGLRQNICLYSTLAGGGDPPTGWTRFAGGGTVASATSIYGTDSAAYTFTAAAARPFIYQSVSLAANTTYTVSCYVEAVTGTLQVQDAITLASAPAGLTLVGHTLNGVTVAAGAALTTGRLAVTFGGIYAAGASLIWMGAGVTTGNVTATVTLSRPQLEAATFPSSYIPTTTTSASRSADLWTISNAQLVAATGQSIPQTGTMFVEFAFAGGASTALADSRAALSLDDGTSAERHIIYNHTSAVGALTTDGAGNNVAAPLVAGAQAVGAIVKAAYSFAANSSNIGVNGSVGTRDVTCTMPTTTTIGIGSQSAGTNAGYVWLRRVIIYPFAMTDAQLQKVTGDNGGALPIDNSIPLLDLDLTSMSGFTLPIGTYTRATGGYTFNSAGVLVANSANLPRVDYDPATLVKRGWLMDGLRQNLMTYSEDASNMNFVGVNAFGAGSTVNAAAWIDGNTVADLMTETATNARHFGYKAIGSLTAASTYCFSAYLKYQARRYVVLAIKTDDSSLAYSVVFDVQNGAVGAGTATIGAPTGTGSGVESCGNGWYRCYVTMNLGGVRTTAFSSVCLSDSATPSYSEEAPTYNGDGTSGVYVCGRQLEAATFPSSYIPTTTAAASRSADLWTISNAQFLAATGQNIPQEGTVFCEFAFAGGDSSMSASARAAVSFDDGTGTNRHLIYNNTGAVGGVTTATTLQAAPLVAGTVTVGTVVKSLYTWKANDCQFWANGSHGTRDATATMPVIDRIGIGSQSNGGNPGFVWLRRLIVYPFHTPLDATGDRMTA